MAVRALTQSRSRAAQDIGSLPPLALGLTLVPTALDLLGIVQSTVQLASVATLACAAAGAVLLLIWLRFPHVSWLLAAGFATGAGLAMRLVGADVAPLLSLLSVLALGVGGAFAGPEVSPAGA